MTVNLITPIQYLPANPSGAGFRGVETVPAIAK